MIINNFSKHITKTLSKLYDCNTIPTANFFIGFSKIVHTFSTIKNPYRNIFLD